MEVPMKETMRSRNPSLCQARTQGSEGREGSTGGKQCRAQPLQELVLVSKRVGLYKSASFRIIPQAAKSPKPIDSLSSLPHHPHASTSYPART